MMEFPFNAATLIRGSQAIFEAGVREALQEAGYTHPHDEYMVQRVLDRTLRRPGYFIALLIESGLKADGDEAR